MYKNIMMMVLILIMAGSASVANVVGAANVPKFMNYQAVLYDDGGNPLPDGTTKIYVRILDSGMSVVYEEVQDVEVISGVVSIMVGEGVSPENGVLTGGISTDLLLPEGPKYLDVQAEGYPPEGLMELVSVPYSSYADVALRVANESVGGSQLKKGSVSLEHFSDELASRLTGGTDGEAGPATVVIKEEFDEFKSDMSSDVGAKQIGVKPGFSFSSADNVQSVLKDFDHAIKKRSEDSKKVDLNNLNINGSEPMTGKLVLQAGGGGDPIQIQGTGWSIDNNGGFSGNLSNTSGNHMGTWQSKEAPDSGVVGTEDTQTLENKTLKSPEVEGELDMGGNRIANLAEPIADSDAATKAYVNKMTEPVPSIAPVADGHGRLYLPPAGGVWIIDEGSTTGMDCTTDTIPLPTPEDWSVTCTFLPRSSVACDGACTLDGDMSNKFTVSGGILIAPVNFTRVMSLVEDPEDSGICYCDEIVSFSVSGVHYAPIGAAMEWWFYKRPISTGENL